MKKITKNGFGDKLEGNELDLSMMNLTEVAVKEIATLTKATKIDLSNNQLVSLPTEFAPSLKHVSKLELGSNKLKSLPDNIDQLGHLKHLDLYNNQLTDLPVNFCLLKNLKWLDLKGNPLNPGLKKAAGDCLNQKECELAAKRVIAYLKRFYILMESEKLEKQRKEKEKEEARFREEEEQQARKRAERKAAKEKRKQDHHNHKTSVQSQKNQSNGSAAAEQKYVAMPKPAPPIVKNKKNKTKKGWSCLGWFNTLLMFCLVAATGAGLYVYTDGNLTPDGIAAAYPRITENAHVLVNLTVEALQPDNLKETAQLVLKNVKETGSTAWAKLEEHTGDLSMYTDPILAALGKGWLLTQEVALLIYDWLAKNIDWEAIAAALRSAWKFLRDQWLVVCEELSKNEALQSGLKTMKAYLLIAWEYLVVSWVALCRMLLVAFEYIQEEGPGILASVKEQATTTLYSAKQSIEGLMK